MKKISFHIATRSGKSLLIALMAASSLAYTGCGKDYDDDLKILKEEIAQNKADLDQIMKDYQTTINNQLAVLEQKHDSDMQDHQTKIDQIKSDLTATQTLVTNNGNAIKALQLSQSELDSALKAYKELVNAQLTGISNDINQINTKLNTLDSRISANEKAITLLQNQATNLEKAIADLKAATDKYTSENDKTIAALTEELATVNEKLSAGEAALAQYKEDVADQFDDVEKSLADLKSEFGNKLESMTLDYKNLINVLNGKVDANNNAQIQRIAALEASFATYQTTVSEKFATLTADILANKTAIGELTTQYGQVIALYAALSKDNETFKAQLAQLEKVTVPALQAKDAELEQSIADLSDQLAQDVAALNTKLEDLESSLTRDLLASANALQLQITANGDLILTNAGLIEGLRTDYGTLNKAVDSLSQALSEKYSELKGVIGDDASGLIRDINENKAAIEAAKTELQGNIDSLAKTILSQSEIEAIVDEKITDAVDAAKNELNTTITAVADRVTVLEGKISAIENAIAALKGRIQSLTFVSEYSDGAATVEIINGKATMYLTYLVSSTSALTEIFKEGEFAVNAKINKVKTRALVDDIVFTLDRTTIDDNNSTVIFELSTDDAAKFGAKTNGIPDEVVTKKTNFQVAVNITDKAGDNITSNFVDIIAVAKSVMDADDLTIAYTSGNGEFVATKEAATAQTPANTIEITGGAAQLNTEIKAYCYDIVAPEYIKIGNIGIVAVYDQNGTELKSHNFAINASTFAISTSNSSYVGKTYKIVIGAYAWDTVANAQFGSEQYSAISVTVNSIAVDSNALVAGKIGQNAVVLLDNAPATAQTASRTYVTIANPIDITGAITLANSTAGYSIKYTCYDTYFGSESKGNYIAFTGNSLSVDSWLSKYNWKMDLSGQWGSVSTTIKAELMYNGVAAETKFFCIQFMNK